MSNFETPAAADETAARIVKEEGVEAPGEREAIEANLEQFSEEAQARLAGLAEGRVDISGEEVQALAEKLQEVADTVFSKSLTVAGLAALAASFVTAVAGGVSFDTTAGLFMAGGGAMGAAVVSADIIEDWPIKQREFIAGAIIKAKDFFGHSDSEGAGEQAV